MLLHLLKFYWILIQHDLPFENQNPPLFSYLDCQHHHRRNAIAIAPPHHRNHRCHVSLCRPLQPPLPHFPLRYRYIFNTTFATTLLSEKPQCCTTTHITPPPKTSPPRATAVLSLIFSCGCHSDIVVTYVACATPATIVGPCRSCRPPTPSCRHPREGLHKW